jgi:muconolactone delta-isomerase
VDDAQAREAERAHELAGQGHLVRLWVLPGQGRALGLWRAQDPAEMPDANTKVQWTFGLGRRTVTLIYFDLKKAWP